MRPALAYTPGRDPLHAAGAPAAIAFLGSFAFVSFLYPSPLVVGAAGISACLIGYAAGAGLAIRTTLRWGLAVALLMTVVNGIVTDRGLTVLLRGGEVPVLGQVNVTLESLAQGATIGLRVLVTLLLFAVYSACVNPDEVLRLLRPLARRSALTATLVGRMVPVAAGDLARLQEGASLRGPAAMPVGRAALARRIVAGSLDRAVDVAATLELRGYALPSTPGNDSGRRRSRHDRLLFAVALLVAGAGLALRLAGAGGYDAYPEVSLDTGPATLVVAAALPLAGLAPFARRRRRRREESR